MITFVNAKINLGLNVVRKREDGYHELETIFYPTGGENTSLCDILEIIPSNSHNDNLTIIGDKIDCPIEKNLVWKALKAFRENCNQRFSSVDIFLEKHLPFGAGMGGGSADAAFTLKMLNKIFDNPFTEQELLQIATSIGADCPFFIYNHPCLAKGIGEKLTPLNLSLKGLWIAIVKPEVSISTKEAFSLIKPVYPNISIEKIASYDILKWREYLVNDFETPMFSLHPEIANIKTTFYECDAIYSSMTGSGSAFYGLFDSEANAITATQKLNLNFSYVGMLND